MGRKLPITIHLAALLLSGCAHVSSTGSGLGETAFFRDKAAEAADPAKALNVHLAVNDIYCKKTACECVHYVASRTYDDVQKVLREQHNIDLELSYFPEIYILEEYLCKREFDGVICKPWDAYRLATGHVERCKRIADVTDPEGNQWLQGLFMVMKDSDIGDLSQLSGKGVALGQPDSYEKFHMPLAMLRDRGIKPAKLIERASCLEATGALMDGKVDVAIVSDYIMTASCVVDIAKPEDFKIIARTPKSPLTSVVMDLDRVSEPDIQRFQTALLTIGGKRAPESLMGNFVKPAKWSPTPLGEDFTLE